MDNSEVAPIAEYGQIRPILMVCRAIRLITVVADRPSLILPEALEPFRESSVYRTVCWMFLCPR